MTGRTVEATGDLPESGTNRLLSLTLDPGSIARGNPNIEHEREVAIFDILDANTFIVDGRNDGPYRLELAVADDRLLFNITPDAGTTTPVSIPVALLPLKRVMKDYFLVCETYYQAIRTSPPSKIQQIDQGRRALHDEGAKSLVDRLAGKLTMDTDTSRRLFTLICALHWKG
ncbi:MAG: UPF0262 family protein [Hyphomicrobiaceae bacterium]|nr:UPF0262 family protein [Hyphomicrobiaceae bacterium]